MAEHFLGSNEKRGKNPENPFLVFFSSCIAQSYKLLQLVLHSKGFSPIVFCVIVTTYNVVQGFRHNSIDLTFQFRLEPIFDIALDAKNGHSIVP